MEQHADATPPTSPVKLAIVGKPACDLRKDAPHLYSALSILTVKQLKSKSTKVELRGCKIKAEIMLAVLATVRRRRCEARSGSQAMLESGFITATNKVILQNRAVVDCEWDAIWLA